MDVVYYVAASLDGYIATSDGGVDWLKPYENGDDDYGFAELYASIDALLMGSHTYEFALKQGSWPTKDKPTWVFTGRDLPILDPSITLTSQQPVEIVELLGSQGMKRAWLTGGGKLATSFRKHGLISQYTISVIPVVLGGGIPLFADAREQDSLELLDVKEYPNGIVQLDYKPKSDG